MSHRRRTPNSNPFQGSEENAEITLANVDAAIFGEFAALDDKRQIAEPVPIKDVLPDLTQPRRAVPWSVRPHWDSRPETVGSLFASWMQLVNTERQQNGLYPFDIAAHLEGQITERADNKLPENRPLGPIEAAFIKVVELAASIRRDGLTNPITVVPYGKQYRLETGERRWLAFHLLSSWFDGSTSYRPDERDRWGKIPARAVEKINVWRQASENNARENLNAIGKARQFAILLMDLLRAEGKRFVSFEETVEPGGCDRGYYAQVANAKVWAVPYGKAEMILNAMGLTSRSAIARCRSLLMLPDAIWQEGDDHDLPEEMLYDLSRLHPEVALARFYQTVASRNSLADEKPAASSGKVVQEVGTSRHFAEMARAVRRAGPSSPQFNESALKGLQELRLWIEEQEERIRSFLK